MSLITDFTEFNDLPSSHLLRVCNWTNLEQIAIEYDYSGSNLISITYLQLYENFKAIEKLLNCLGRSKFIGITSDIPIFCIPAVILGIISSGRAFVYLEKRSEWLQDFLELRYTFSGSEGDKLVEKITVHEQELYLMRKREASTVDETAEASKNEFAYAVTTSGSTGQPVAVKVTHACILPNITALSKTFELSNRDRVVQLTPLSFDPSIVEIFLSLTSGGTLFTVSDELKNHPDKLLMSLVKNQVTLISTTPSLLLNRWSCLQTSLLAEKSQLRVLLLGGESFPSAEILGRIRHPKNSTLIFNIYGITEVSCWTSINQILPGVEDTHENLGKLLQDTIFQVKNYDNEIVDDGEGILFIGSNTRICEIGHEKFGNLKPPVFRNTGDIVRLNGKTGEIYFHGRQDSCIKRFGSKVCINNLKYYCQTLPFVQNIEVLWSQQLSTLDVFFTASKMQEIEAKKLIDEFWAHVQQLPAILQPDNIYLLEKFELTHHGKICREFLKNFRQQSLSLNNTEGTLRQIWKSHLPVSDQLGFLDAGGTSFMAIEISNKLRIDTGTSFSHLIGMFLENSTLEACCRYITQHNSHEYSLEDVNSKDGHFSSFTKWQPSKTAIQVQYSCLWQKCKGKTTISNEELMENHNSSSLSHEFNHFLQEISTHNLEKCVDAAPTIFSYSNGQIFATVGSHSGIICTVDLHTNAFWKIQLPDRIEASILVLDDFQAIVGCYNGTIFCLHLQTGAILWTFHTGNMIKCLAVLCSTKERIFFGSYDHFLYCLTLKTGNLLWKRRAASAKATPLVHDETCSVIFTLLDGWCLSVNQLTGKIHWKHQLNNPIFSSPVIYNQQIIVADVQGEFTALDTLGGRKLWEFTVSSNIFSDLIIHRTSNCQVESLMFASKDGSVHKYILRGSEAPKFDFKTDNDTPITATPFASENLLVLARENGKLELRNGENGRLISTINLPGDCFSSPVLENSSIIVGCRNNSLCIVKLIKN